jgi:hypothetical protein
MTALLPLTTLFPSVPSPLRIAAAEPSAKPAATTSAATPTPTAAATVEATRTADIQNQNNGVMGLIHTSLTGLSNFIKNLPPRKTLLGE